ncbi:MAG: cation:proton antiporter, partial [Thermomicrobiales bacterium]
MPALPLTDIAAHLLTGGIVPMSAPVPEFLPEAVALLAAAAVIAYLCSLVKVVPIAGFLLAGVAIGPHALGLVDDIELVEAAAELGVVLLLFTIGIEFRLEQLARIRRAIFAGGGLQVALTIVAVVAALLPFGVSWRDAFFTGCLVSLSSTAIVLKVLGDRRATNSTVGRQTLGILIFQDLAVVAMVLVVPMLGDEAGGSALDIVRAIGSAVGIVVLVLVVARRLVPPLVEAVARTCSPEIFLLSLITLCFGTAYLTSLAGVSLALGAFLAGLLVSESRFSHHALGEIMPLQILFSATFFVSVGMLLDLGFLLDNLPLVLLVVLVVVALKTAVTGLSVRLMGTLTPTALGGGLLLAQVGEFSFVLNQVGIDAGLSPAGLGERGGATFVAASVILLLMTPFLADAGLKLDGRGRAAMRRAATQPGGDGSGPAPAATAGISTASATAAGATPSPTTTMSTRPANRTQATGANGPGGASGSAGTDGVAATAAATVTVPLARPGTRPGTTGDTSPTGTTAADPDDRAAAGTSAGDADVSGVGEGGGGTDGHAWADHVIVDGWGPAGEAVAHALTAASVPFVILPRNPEGALVAEGAAMPV